MNLLVLQRVSTLQQTISAGSSTQSGIFVVKYDECGEFQWVVHSQQINSTALIISGLDLQFANGYIGLYGQWDNLGPNGDFTLKSSGSGTNVTISNSNLINEDVFFTQISNSGDIGTSAANTPPVSSFFDIDLTDIVNQVYYDQTNNLHYFAGQFAGKAAVQKYDGSNQSLINSPVEDINSGNEITGMVEDNGHIYAIANIYGQGNFGVGNIIPQGSEEAVILASDGSSVFHMLPAGAQNRVSANDIEMDMVGDLWVALEFEQKLLYGVLKPQPLLQQW